MSIKNIALMGLGVIGIPIAHKLNNTFWGHFYLVADSIHKHRLLEQEMYINGDRFAPPILPDSAQMQDSIDLIIVCVKNYDLVSTLAELKKVVGKQTIILPLQNGVYAHEFYSKAFPDNVVLQGYIQGPNTQKDGNLMTYENPGVIHIGAIDEVQIPYVTAVCHRLETAGVPFVCEKDIRRMVWKKWMLNVAGNGVTALTGADYSDFPIYDELRNLCTDIMKEFIQVAKAENVFLCEDDIQDIIHYYVSYNGHKKTSMLMDVLNQRKTENDYLAGKVVEIAQRHDIAVPKIHTIYDLMEVKEKVYMDRKGVRTMKNLFREGVQYSEDLQREMRDIDRKMEDPDYARQVNTGSVPEVQDLLVYAIDNTLFYSHLEKKSITLQDFPVMNKTILNQNYDAIKVHRYDSQKTHKMHTSGSTGIPFTVIQNMEKRQRHIADLKYFGALAGYRDQDPMCYLRAKPTATEEEQARDNIWQLDICNLNEKNLTDYYHVMVEKKCTALMAYPSTLETAVDFWAAHFSNNTCVETIISTSETLTDKVKEKLRAFFGKNVNVYARYSNTENGILGQETGESGIYKLNWASYYFEILKLDKDEPADEGELGRIVVTDLYNKAFPMIRYDTGDVGKFKRGEENQLPEIVDLYGRRMDLIYDTRGEVVSPFLLCRTMRLSHGIEQWQFVQETEKEYLLKITSTKHEKIDCTKELESFQKTLGPEAKIEVEYVDEIPVLNSLKRKLIVSHLSI